MSGECDNCGEHALECKCDSLYYSKKNEWIRVKNIPKDDQTVFVINKKVPMLPVKAYYCEEYDEFMSLEISGTNHPLSITHWMPVPQSPKEKYE